MTRNLDAKRGNEELLLFLKMESLFVLQPSRFYRPDEDLKRSLRIVDFGEFSILQPFLFERVESLHHFSPSRSVFIGSSESSRMSSSNVSRSSLS